MTWYNANWKSRYPITIDVLGGSESSGQEDVQFSIPSDWDDFWDNIRADGFDIIVADGTGNLETFQITAASFSKTNRVCQISLNNVTFGNRNAINVLFLYYNNPDQASSLGSTFSPSSPKTAKIFLVAPSNRIVGDPIPRNGATTPPATFQKTTNDEVYIWFRIKSLLAQRIQPYNGKLDFETIQYIQVYSNNAAGSSDTSRLREELTAVIPGWIGVCVAEGTNNEDYTVNAIVQTHATEFNQKLSLNALLQVRNLFPLS